MTENEIYELFSRARQPRDVEARLELLKYRERLSRDFTANTLREIYRQIYSMIGKLLQSNPSLINEVKSEDENFKRAPGIKTLHALINAITEACRRKSMRAFFSVNDKISSIIKNTISNVSTILNSKFPGLREEGSQESKEIINASSDVIKQRDFIGLANFVKVLTTKGPEVHYDVMFDEYTISCVSSGIPEIIDSFFDSESFVYEKVMPVRHSSSHEKNGDATYISFYLEPGYALKSETLTLPITRGKSELEKETFQVPIQTPFLTSDEDIDGHSINIELGSDKTNSVRTLNGIVSSLSLAFGRDNVELEIEDAQNIGLAWELQSSFSAKQSTFNKTEETVKESLEALKKCIDSRIDKFGNFMSASRKMRELVANPVIVVFFNPQNLSKNSLELYKEILKRGYRAGVIPISLLPYNDFIKSLNHSNRSISIFTDNHWAISNPFDCVRPYGMEINDGNWFSDWIKGGKKIDKRWRSGFGTQSETSDSHIEALEFDKDFIELRDARLVTPIGETNRGDFNFSLDTNSHVHAFIIGKTGSGKSELLHNIITGLIQRYSPLDLELLLLDFKLGGVEFNRYKDIKHIRSLLVDNSDFQIVLEIMRDLDSQMRDRGKILRNSGCSNIVDYNNEHPAHPLPQIVLIIDECHQIFVNNDRNNSDMFSEVSSILTKVAKEGRNQGVHMILATQTLAGADIPQDILNNITDFYLMNCSPTDSEKLVNGSSNKTHNLKVGNVYYHHVNHVEFFQGYYQPSKEKNYDTIKQVVQKSNGFGSNGQLYFNGSQEYELKDSHPDVNLLSSDINLIGGKSIDMKREDIIVTLAPVNNENILVTGLNIEDNLVRTSVGLIVSRLILDKITNKKTRIVVLNSMRQPTASIELLIKLGAEGLIEYIDSKKLPIIEEIAMSILDKTEIAPTLFCIIGQEQMEELRNNSPLFAAEETLEDNGNLGLMDNLDFGVSDSQIKRPKNIRDAIKIIMEQGPISGVHTILQLDKIDKFLFDDSLYGKEVRKFFKHIIFLKSNENLIPYLGLDDNIHPERLSQEDSRLRAIYYNDDLETHRLFTPYKTQTYDDIKSII